ncbi:MAG: hypothetical protein M3Q70_00625 [bacterium]|nr:hypothetical protein [bacterium]
MTNKNEGVKEVVYPEVDQFGRELNPLFYLNALSKHVAEWRENNAKISPSSPNNYVLKRVFGSEV